METTANPVPAMPAVMVEQGAAGTQQGHPIHRDRLLTATEIADFLQVEVKTIYKWSSQGRIPCVKFSGKCVRFDLEKVRAWCQSMAQKGRKTKRVEVDAA